MRQKLLLLFISIISCYINTYGQDEYGVWLHDGNEIHSTNFYDKNGNKIDVSYDCILVDVYKNETRIGFTVHSKDGEKYLYFWPGPHTYIQYCDNRFEIKVFKMSSKQYDLKRDKPVYWIWEGEKMLFGYTFSGVIPPGITFDIIDPDKGIPNFFNIPPIPIEYANTTNDKGSYGFPILSNWTEESIRQFAKTHNDGICGIYEGINGGKYKLGCIKENNEYKFIYLSGGGENCWWHSSDVKARLRSSATQGLFKADWLMFDKSVNSDVYVNFNGATMDVFINGGKESYLKMYPPIGNNNASSSTNNNIYEPPFYAKWSGSGFALNNGYICTNHHVIDGANNIKIYGVKGNFNIGYNARVVLSDSHNDLAVLKINDSRFSGFGTIPYRVKTNMAEVGESCFVLGYPMTATMGDEIKLTTGVVSAKSGFQGDLSLYQISAPIQPGNSGGPLFDNNGNLIGIVNSKHTGAENVGYAIKASYLSNLIQSGSLSGLLPQSNTISGQNLSGKVKSVKNYVYLIKCN